MSEIDAFDRRIMDALSVDGRMTLTRLSRTIGLSVTPCQMRLKRLEARGYIRGYAAVLDPVKLGRDHISFVQVKLSDTRAPALKAFNEAVMELAEVEQCHMIAGGFDYLLKVRTESMARYREVMGERISTLPHVSVTSTFVAMEAVKEDVFHRVSPKSGHRFSDH